MLSTIDNPYNPFTDYGKWLQWDHDHEYFTQEYLARIANISIEMEDEAADMLIEQAMREIVENDESGTFIIVKQ